MDRKAIATALAKAQAYKKVGNQARADEWARTLVNLLECAGILADPNELTIASAVHRAAREDALDADEIEDLFRAALDAEFEGAAE